MGRTVSDAHKPGKRKTEVCADRGPAPFVRVPTNSVKWWNTSSIRRLGRAVPAGRSAPMGLASPTGRRTRGGRTMKLSWLCGKCSTRLPDREPHHPYEQPDQGLHTTLVFYIKSKD